MARSGGGRQETRVLERTEAEGRDLPARVTWVDRKGMGVGMGWRKKPTWHCTLKVTSVSARGVGQDLGNVR